MKKFLLLLLLMFSVSFFTELFSQNQKSSMIMNEEDEEEGHLKFKEWYEDMHRAAPGVNWRQMDEQTRYDNYTAIPKKSSGPVTAGMQEDLHPSSSDFVAIPATPANGPELLWLLLGSGGLGAGIRRLRRPRR